MINSKKLHNFLSKKGLENFIDDLDSILKKFLEKFKSIVIYPNNLQPLIYTYVNKNLKNKNTIRHESRGNTKRSIVNLFGQVYLKRKSKEQILLNIK